ncbi:hypothetical protein C8R44DRAFT_896392 [Mycena epipterygia]|nr:hypothetical protein C8R44DRAFT_896392 [Mycena epipterygia]
MSSSTPTTHASRNPGRAVQERRGRTRGTLTNSQKATRERQTTLRQIAAEDLNEDLDAFYGYRTRLCKTLALKHNKTEDYINKLLINASQYKNQRALSLRNALVIDFRIKGRAGEKTALKSLQAMADAVLAKEPVRADEKKRLMDQGNASRQLKKRGTRASNKSAAADTRSTIARMQDELIDLDERTGTRGFAFITRGHVDDSQLPTFIDSGDSAKFCIEVLKVSAVDLLRRFEQWTCTRDKAARRDTRRLMISETVGLIEAALRAITKKSNLTMSYVYLDVDIREPFHVEIAGWPHDIPMLSPAKIKGVERVRRLRDGWLNKTITWVRMDDKQVMQLTTDLAKQRAKKGGILKLKNTRSDKGGTHRKGKGKGREESDEEEEGDDIDESEEEEEDDDDNEDSEGTNAPSTSHIPIAAVPIRLAGVSGENTTIPHHLAGVSSENEPPSSAAFDPSAPLDMSFFDPTMLFLDNFPDLDMSAVPSFDFSTYQMDTSTDPIGTSPSTLDASNVPSSPPNASIGPVVPSTHVIAYATSPVLAPPTLAPPTLAPTPLADRSNCPGPLPTGVKRKAADDSNEAPAKKPRKERSDKGKPRGTRAAEALAPGSAPLKRATTAATKTARTASASRKVPGSGKGKGPRDDEVTRRVRDEMNAKSRAALAADAEIASGSAADHTAA